MTTITTTTTKLTTNLATTSTTTSSSIETPQTSQPVYHTKESVSKLSDQELFDLLDTLDNSCRIKKPNSILTVPLLTPTSLIKSTVSGGSVDYMCTKCKNDELIMEDFSAGMEVCTGCGTILSTIVDRNPEWKRYDNEGGAKTVGRCSKPISYFYPQSSLGTSIGGNYKNKVKILHSWSAMPYKERSLYLIIKDIQDGCRRAGILKCIEDDAKILCKNISECKHVKGDNKGKKVINRGKNRKGLVAACVFFACRRKGETRSPKEIADIFGLKFTEITKGCKLFIKMMKLVSITYNLNSSTAEHFIPRFCYKLHLKDEYIKKTVQIASNIQKLNIASVHTPLSLATGSILLMADINKLTNITRRMIADTFEVTEVTVNKTFNKLYEYKSILADNRLTDLLVRLIDEQRSNSVIPSRITSRYNKVKTALAEAKRDTNLVKGGYVVDMKDDDKYDDKDDKDLDIEYNEMFDISKYSSLNDYIDTYTSDLDKSITMNDVEHTKLVADFSKWPKSVKALQRRITRFKRFKRVQNMYSVVY